ncbi:MAG TPA: asparagine synthase-related protein, partial [Kribbellaceae bacterium]
PHDAVRSVKGSVHRIVSAAGTTRVEGSLSGLRRVFAIGTGGVTVGGDRADVLAGLTGVAPDPVRVATRLLYPAIPWPVGWQPVWREVGAVLPGHYLTLDSGETTRWWVPPEPTLSLAGSAEALRAALVDAVRVRLRPGRPVVSHLSGLDSSSLFSIAVAEGADVLGITAAQPDAMDSDVEWARRTVAALNAPHARHEVIPADEVPLVYDGILRAGDRLDEPFGYVHNRERYLGILARGERVAPSAHLMGLGGDELCAPVPQWLHTLLMRSPATGVRRLRAVAAKNRWAYRDVARNLARGRSYPGWLRGVAERLGEPVGVKDPGLGWGVTPVVPAWTTPDAVAAVAAEIAAAAAAPDSALAADRGLHRTLEVIYSGAQTMRGFQAIAAGRGITVAAPFFDDEVVTAALSARLDDRVDPARYKPVLVEAMRGIVPAVTLGRTSKSETAATAVMGSREHRDQLTGLAEDSRLAGLGLVDSEQLSEVVRGPIDIRTPNRRIEPTIGCEIWLRNEAANVRIGT